MAAQHVGQHSAAPRRKAQGPRPIGRIETVPGAPQPQSPSPHGNCTPWTLWACGRSARAGARRWEMRPATAARPSARPPTRSPTTATMKTVSDGREGVAARRGGAPDAPPRASADRGPRVPRGPLPPPQHPCHPSIDAPPPASPLATGRRSSRTIRWEGALEARFLKALQQVGGVWVSGHRGEALGPRPGRHLASKSGPLGAPQRPQPPPRAPPGAPGAGPPGPGPRAARTRRPAPPPYPGASGAERKRRSRPRAPPPLPLPQEAKPKAILMKMGAYASQLTTIQVRRPPAPGGGGTSM